MVFVLYPGVSKKVHLFDFGLPGGLGIFGGFHHCTENPRIGAKPCIGFFGRLRSCWMMDPMDVGGRITWVAPAKVQHHKSPKWLNFEFFF